MTTCDHCEYQWEYGGELKQATCPSCGRKTTVEDSAQPKG